MLHIIVRESEMMSQGSIFSQGRTYYMLPIGIRLPWGVYFFLSIAYIFSRITPLLETDTVKRRAYKQKELDGLPLRRTRLNYQVEKPPTSKRSIKNGQSNSHTGKLDVGEPPVAVRRPYLRP